MTYRKRLLLLSALEVFQFIYRWLVFVFICLINVILYTKSGNVMKHLYFTADNENKTRIDLGLLPIRRQAIICTNDISFHKWAPLAKGNQI